jgi:hypothetical protein
VLGPFPSPSPACPIGPRPLGLGSRISGIIMSAPPLDDRIGAGSAAPGDSRRLILAWRARRLQHCHVPIPHLQVWQRAPEPASPCQCDWPPLPSLTPFPRTSAGNDAAQAETTPEDQDGMLAMPATKNQGVFSGPRRAGWIWTGRT